MREKPDAIAARAAVETLIRFIGDDPEREGLKQTPARVLAAWRQAWGAGYDTPEPELTMFKEEKNYDQMVTVCGISFYSMCEHHMAPFMGTADVSYIPSNSGIVGLSKLSRVVQHFAGRLQTQERLTAQIADYIGKISGHAGVRMRATHMCMASRGVRQPIAQTITTALRGDYLDDPSVKAEFLAGIK